MHVLTEMMGYGCPRRQKLQFPSLLHARDIAVHGLVLSVLAVSIQSSETRSLTNHRLCCTTVDHSHTHTHHTSTH